MPSRTLVVHSDPDILGGTPVFVGTRVPVQSLFDYLEGGETLDEFLRQFPSVKREQADIPVGVATLLAGHDVQTVSGLRWQGLKNGELLERAGGRFDAFITMDRNIKQQQALADRSFGVVLLRAPSNRIEDLRAVVPALIQALDSLRAGEIVRVGA